MYFDVNVCGSASVVSREDGGELSDAVLVSWVGGA